MTLADQGAAPPAVGTDAVRIPVFPLVLLLALLVAAGAGIMLLLRPHVEVTNALAAPVKLVVGDAAPRAVAPGGTVRMAVPRGRTTVAQWQLERPLSADSTPMGQEVRGSSVLRSPSGTVRLRAVSRRGDNAYFAPLITNASTRPLRIAVNAGLQGAVDCGCAVRPGARRVFIGYYRLFQNSTVQARVTGPGQARGSAMFRDLGAQVTAPDGTVGLRFEDKDLR
jgi:hypothetical protein